MQRFSNQNLSPIKNLTTADSSNGEAVEISHNLAIYIDVDVSDVTPAPVAIVAASWNASTDIVTLTAHGFQTCLKGRFASSGTLPAGISAATDYFLIRVSADTFKIAVSRQDARAGIAVDFTGAGIGSHTFTPTSADVRIKLQSSVSKTDKWRDIPGASFTSIAPTSFNIQGAAFPYIRAIIEVTAGQVFASVTCFAKGE